MPLWAASPRCLKAALALKCRCTAWNHVWCSNAAAGCQPVLCGSSFNAQNAAAGCRPAPLGSSFGAHLPLQAASPQCLEAAWCLNAAAGSQPALRGNSFCGCRLPARTAWKQPWCSSAAACYQPAALANAMPLQAVSLHCLFGAQMLLRAASPHRLEAALVLKCRCKLLAGTAWKQLWCSNAAAGCEPAPLGSGFGAQMPLRAASPHRPESSFGAQMPLRLTRTAWKQLWCSNAGLALLGSRFAGCQPALLGSSCGAQMPLQAASAHWLGSSFGANQPAPLRSSIGAQMPLVKFQHFPSRGGFRSAIFFKVNKCVFNPCHVFKWPF